MDVAHDQGYGRFGADGGGRDVVIAGGGVFDEALEAEDAELSPAGGEVGFGYFCHTGERHDFIIRFGAHGYSIRDGLGLMQLGRRLWPGQRVRFALARECPLMR